MAILRFSLGKFFALIIVCESKIDFHVYSMLFKLIKVDNDIEKKKSRHVMQQMSLHTRVLKNKISNRHINAFDGNSAGSCRIVRRFNYRIFL